MKLYCCHFFTVYFFICGNFRSNWNQPFKAILFDLSASLQDVGNYILGGDATVDVLAGKTTRGSTITGALPLLTPCSFLPPVAVLIRKLSGSLSGRVVSGSMLIFVSSAEHTCPVNLHPDI